MVLLLVMAMIMPSLKYVFFVLATGAAGINIRALVVLYFKNKDNKQWLPPAQRLVIYYDLKDYIESAIKENNDHSSKFICHSLWKLGYHPNRLTEKDHMIFKLKELVELRNTIPERIIWYIPDISNPLYAHADNRVLRLAIVNEAIRILKQKQNA